MTFEESFPNLKKNPANYRITSEATRSYNCIAWASGETHRWWWPDPDDQYYYWPSDLPREQTLSVFIRAYEGLGYALCSNFELEKDYLKVAIFADKDGNPTHAARQLANGRWTSKLGKDVDIEHELNGVEGPVYGTAVRVLKKRIDFA
ncbi:MAG: hypothetical protein HY580_06435 [Nitrospinae bacterium]|nr:hypothetical protein [Nitrospinota bacterium]